MIDDFEVQIENAEKDNLKKIIQYKKRYSLFKQILIAIFDPISFVLIKASGEKLYNALFKYENGF